MGRSNLNFWRRRYLLRHYRQCDDRTLAAGAGIPQARAAEFLARMGATRSVGDLKRIAAAGVVSPPTMLTPEVARRAMTRLESRRLTGLDRLLIAAMSVASLVLYAMTCARTVTGEDAGELLAAAHEFGVPHPPGSPLWLILSWTADHSMPWLTTAWRVAMVSGISAAAANALLLAVALKTISDRLRRLKSGITAAAEAPAELDAEALRDPQHASVLSPPLPRLPSDPASIRFDVSGGLPLRPRQ